MHVKVLYNLENRSKHKEKQLFIPRYFRNRNWTKKGNFYFVIG